MAEPADELGLVERVGGHLHAAHGLHLLVHRQELIPGDLDLEVGGVAEVGLEGVLVELDGEGRGVVVGLVPQLGVGRGGLHGAGEAEAGGDWLLLQVAGGNGLKLARVFCGPPATVTGTRKTYQLPGEPSAG